MIVYYRTDFNIDFKVSALNLANGTKVYLTIKKSVDADENDTSTILEKVVTTTQNHQQTVTFTFDSDSDTDYANILPDITYVYGLLCQSPDSSPNDKWLPVELSDSSIIFKRTVKNTR
jgi:hypothetical protein